MRNALIIVGIGVIILGGGWWYLEEHRASATNPHEDAPVKTTTPIQKIPTEAEQGGVSGGVDNTVTFQCDGGKTMTVVFTNNLAGLTLGTRHVTLYQATSGSGTRYLNNDQTVELSAKGESAIVKENGTITYNNCVARN